MPSFEFGLAEIVGPDHFQFSVFRALAAWAWKAGSSAASLSSLEATPANGDLGEYCGDIRIFSQLPHFTTLRPVQKPVQLPPWSAQKESLMVHASADFQLFTIRGLFRNQQVAGSIPAGGSIYLV